MAIASIAGGVSTTVTIRFVDKNQQPFTLSFFCDPTATDAQLITFFTSLQVLTNAQIVSGVREAKTDIVYNGFAALPANPPNYATVDNVMALDFSGANPLKPRGVINKVFPIPAYIVGKASLTYPNAGQPNATDPDELTVINFLNSFLQYRYSGDGIIRGGLTYNGAKSEGLSLPDIVDNT